MTLFLPRPTRGHRRSFRNPIFRWRQRHLSQRDTQNNWRRWGPKNQCTRWWSVPASGRCFLFIQHPVEIFLRHLLVFQAYLSVYKDYWSQQPPRSSLSVYMEHSQDLQEPDAPDGGRGEHLAIGAHAQHDDGRSHNYQVWKAERLDQLHLVFAQNTCFTKIPSLNLCLEKFQIIAFHVVFSYQTPKDVPKKSA